MTTRAGHIASLIIAIFFALLMVASWFPSSQDYGHHRKLVTGQDLAHFYKEETERREGVASRVNAAPPPQLKAPEYQKAAPVRKEEKPLTFKAAAAQPQTSSSETESSVMTWLEYFFFDIRITDIIIAVFAGLIWWHMRELGAEAREMTDEMRASADQMAQAAGNLDKAAKAQAALAAKLEAAALAKPAPAKRGRPPASAAAKTAPIKTAKAKPAKTVKAAKPNGAPRDKTEEG